MICISTGDHRIALKSVANPNQISMNFIFKTYRDEWLTWLRRKDDVEVVFSK
jgi:hypothetical protein